jgi:hypothetical protein
MKLGIIPALIIALAVAPVLRADPAPAATAIPTPISSQPTPLPQATPIPNPAPAEATPATGALGTGLSWSSIGWGALIVALVVGAVALIAAQSKSSSSGGSSGSGGTGY